MDEGLMQGMIRMKEQRVYWTDVAQERMTKWVFRARREMLHCRRVGQVQARGGKIRGILTERQWNGLEDCVKRSRGGAWEREQPASPCLRESHTFFFFLYSAVRRSASLMPFPPRSSPTRVSSRLLASPLYLFPFPRVALDPLPAFLPYLLSAPAD